MPRLQHDAVKAVSDYVKLRYSHWTKKERKLRRKQIIGALKKESPERVQQYMEEVQEALTRSGQ